MIETLTSENIALKNTQGFTKQKIWDEFKDFASNDGKVWKEEKEKDKISFKEIFEQQKLESKMRMEKVVVKVLKNNENTVRETVKNKKI